MSAQMACQLSLLWVLHFCPRGQVSFHGSQVTCGRSGIITKSWVSAEPVVVAGPGSLDAELVGVVVASVPVVGEAVVLGTEVVVVAPDVSVVAVCPGLSGPHASTAMKRN